MSVDKTSFGDIRLRKSSKFMIATAVATAVIACFQLRNGVEAVAPLTVLGVIATSAAIGLIIVGLTFFMFDKVGTDTDSDDTTSTPAGQLSAKRATALELAQQVLQQLNCKYQYDEKEKHISFEYQGAGFELYASNDWLLSIALLNWETVSTMDFDNVAVMQKVINSINSTLAQATTFYTFYNEQDEMYVSAKCSLPLVQEIPDLKDYFTAALTSLFNIVRATDSNYQKDKVKAENEA